MGPKAKVYLENKAEEINARGDGLITDLDIWKAWKATKIPKATLRVCYWCISTHDLSLLTHIQ